MHGVLHPDLIEQFDNDILVNRFNAWRELTLGQTTPKTFDPEAASHYEPPPPAAVWKPSLLSRWPGSPPGASTAMPEARC
jgi:hypothetical protein